MGRHSSVRYSFERGATASGVQRHLITGSLDLDHASKLRLDLMALGEGSHELDLSEVVHFDGSCAAVLVAMRARVCSRGGDLTWKGVSQEATALLDLEGAHEREELLRPSGLHVGLFDQIGRSTLSLFDVMQGVLTYAGRLTLSAAKIVRKPKTLPMREVVTLAERAGADGFPIVFMISFLIGLITAFQAAVQLQQFGADLYVADLVGLSVVRELGPLMTAIVVAGRSGAAFAAEIGTMEVSEEIDALETLRIDPISHLVWPRIIALLVVVPILTLLANATGILGGVVTAMLRLDVTLYGYLLETQSAIGLGDLLGGLVKAAVFGVLIALISCERGLATRGGATGVGRSTTAAVVAILFHLVAADAVFSVLYNFLGI